MTSVRLPDALEQRLHNVAVKTNRTKSYYLIKAIRAFLDQNEQKLLYLADLQRGTLPSKSFLQNLAERNQDK